MSSANALNLAKILSSGTGISLKIERYRPKAQTACRLQDHPRLLYHIGSKMMYRRVKDSLDIFFVVHLVYAVIKMTFPTENDTLNVFFFLRFRSTKGCKTLYSTTNSDFFRIDCLYRKQNSITKFESNTYEPILFDRMRKLWEKEGIGKKKL